MQRTVVAVTLDTEKSNAAIAKEFLQGSDDEQLEVTLQYNGTDILIPDTADVELNFAHNYRLENGMPLYDSLDIVKKGDSDYTVLILGNKISFNANEKMTGNYGTNALIIKVVDGITTYNYAATYVVAPNAAYDFKIPHNLLTYDQILNNYQAMKTVVDAYAILTGTLNGIPNVEDGAVLFKKDGVVKSIGMKLNPFTSVIESPYAIKVPPTTLYLGENVSIHENGGFVENEVAVSNKKYLMVDYLNDKTAGTSKPVYWKRGALNENQTDPIVLQPDRSVEMKNVTQITYGYEPKDMQVQALYLEFINAVNNFSFMVNVNGLNAAYYPSKEAWDGLKSGLTIPAGKFRIDLNPWFSSLTSYNIVFNYKADTPINLLGNGTIPWMAVDRNLITQHEIALMDDVVSSGGDTPSVIVAKLESLSGDDRVDASAIKNIPTGAKTLLELTDTPDSYAGKGGKIVRVKNDETGISFDTPPNFALPDLSNVSASDLKKSAVAAGMLQQDLEDVDLAKLKEKVDAAGASLVTVGELHGDYHQGEVREIQTHNGLDVTIDTQNKVASISLSTDMLALPDEVARIKTNLAADDTVFSYRGTKAPNYSGGPYKQYYVNITNASGGIAMKLPADAPVNAIFTVRNSDKSNNFVLSVDTGTINNGSNTYNIQENGLALFIKNSASNWNAIYGGYMANNLRQLVDLIKAQLPPNTGLTIDQIQAQLKDRLHLFSEIQAEFNDELHSFDAIEANMITRGFSKGFSVGYGTLDTSTPPQNLNWVTAHISPNAEVVIPATNQGNKYLAIYMPVYLGALVSDVEINQVAATTTESKIVANELDYTVLVVNTPINTNQSNRLNIEFHNKGAIGGIGVEDQRSNVFIDMNTVSFGAGFTATQDPNDAKTVKIDYSGTNEITFKDGMTGQDFTATKIQSADKSIRIANLNGVADFSKGIPDHNEGIHACLGYDELVNSKFGKSKLYFADTRVKGGMFVYPDMNTKSFVIQDTDPTDDPNVSGGTTFIIALYFEPNPDEENKVTQDGKIVIELVDDNDLPIIGTDGNPMGAVIDYKANDIVKPELYIGECQATAFTRVHFKIDLQFTNEEIISVGANTQLCIQSIGKDESSGLALLSFMAFTGYQIAFDTKYYGYNSLNMAQFLTFDVPEANTNAQQMSFGNNTYLDFKNNVKLGIVNNHLTIKDDGVNLPVWTIIKVYDKIDSHSIGGKNYKVTATLTDKDDAYRVSLMEYVGNANPVPLPVVLKYDNQNPVFTAGWVQRDSMFISEDAVSGDHTQSQTFTMPVNAKSLAIIMYHVESQIPVNISLKDLEGDITPWFNRVVITDNSHIKENYLQAHDYIYRSIVKTPNGDIAYRYTANSADTKVPIGVISGGDGKIVNDNAWTDPGSIDPNKTQGDFKFLADGKITMFYTARCFNEQGSVNQIQFWLAKNVGGVFTEVPDSKTTTTIEAQRTKPKMVSSFKFSFDVKANETYRMFMKSDKDDGFYIQSDLDGVPLFRADIEFNEFTAEEKALTDRITYLETHADEIVFVKTGQPVADPTKYKLQIDVDTGKTSIKNI